MSKVSTEDCKNFLTANCGVSTSEKLKRLRKYKDNDGLYIREFVDSKGTVFLVKEMTDQSLELHVGEVREQQIKTKADFDGRKFIKALIKGLEEGEDDNLIEDSMDKVQAFSLEKKKAIAEQFYFYLPDDTYHNDISTLSQGVDTLMLNSQEESYCLFFYDKFKSDLDCGITDILKGILPDYFDKVDEYHFEINTFEQDNKEILRKLTIKDVISMMEDLGFKYKSENEYSEEGCMLKKLPKNKSPKIK